MIRFINTFQNHSALISIFLGCAIGLNGFFVDKENNFLHWSWALQISLMVAFISNEIGRYRSEKQSIEEKFKRHLLAFATWQETGENCWHQKGDPDFVVEPTEDDFWEVKAGENWVRAATNPRAFVRPMQLRYRHTVISKINCIYFDEMRYFIPAPRITGMIGSGEKWYYSLCADDLDFFLLPLLTGRSKDEILEDGRFHSRLSDVPVCVFKSHQEKSSFQVYLAQRPIEPSELKPHIPYMSDGLVTAKDEEIISYSNAVIRRLNEYRELPL